MKLKDARKLSRITQAQLASYLGLNQTMVSQWENKAVCPKAEHRKKIDELLAAKVDWEAEYLPLDRVEGEALLRFLVHMHKKGAFTGALTELLLHPNLYDIRQLLKIKGFLPPDYLPEYSLDEKPLLPLGVKDGGGLNGVHDNQRETEAQKN